MKLKTKRKRTKITLPAQPPKSESRPKQNLKNEISGLLLVAAGIILALALLSYHQSDPVGFLDENNRYQVQNWLGVFGATIAAPLFQWTLGYPILVLPAILVMFGFNLLLRNPYKAIIRPTLILISWSVFLSISLAFPESLRNFGNFQTFYPSGFAGGLIAAYLVKIFSKFGAILILLIIFLVMLIITFQLRISSIPIIVVGFFQYIFKKTSEIVKSMFLKIRLVLARVKSRKKTGTKPGLAEPISDEEVSKDPRYQPTLPSEKELIPDSEDQPLEILHRSKQDDDEFDVKNTISAVNSIEVAVAEAPGNEEGSDLGFEVQEAHQEKELDYDALIRDSLAKYQFPSSELLIEHDSPDFHLSEEELKINAKLLEETLAQFGVKAAVNRVVEGPVITLYEVKPAQGVKISQIVGLIDDLALAMRAKGIRMVAPIPGKAAIGIEIPNREPSVVYFKSLVRSETFIRYDARLPIGIGKTISGEVYCADLTKMPHLLIAGATGSGKSVGINTVIGSLLYRIPPSDLKFVLIDPKKLELSIYAKLKEQYLAVCPELDEIVITHPQNAIMILRSVVNEMEARYDKLAALGVREITHYNRKIEEYKQNGESSEEFRHLPYLVIVVDELADLILSATREIEEPITRLAQMARAVGIHLIMATQRPSVDILTGLIKANFPARVAYQVATRPDSKVILDMHGAERLIGNGDMLFLPPGKVKPLRLQNPLITTEEVERIIKHIRKQPKFPPYELKLFKSREKGPGTSKIFERDELFEKAKDTVIRYQQGSVSLLQRKLKIGYARAARIIDELEEAGIVGPPMQEGKAREVLVSSYSPDLNN